MARRFDWTTELVTTTEFTPEGSNACKAATKLLANPVVSTVPVNVTVCVCEKNNETREKSQSIHQANKKIVSQTEEEW